MSKSLKKNVLITLHGIGTYGIWQKDLKEIVSKSNPNFECYSMNYGYISPLRASIPYLRKKIVDKNNEYLRKIIQDNHEKDIHIIAHSFGTYAILQYLIQNNTHKNIKTLILSGSIVKADYLSKLVTKKKIHITKNIKTFINDTGQSDKNLLITKLCIMNFGDAGRKGFIHSDDTNVHNRYFQGGHKLYFKKTFYKEYWLPYILSDKEVESIDERKKGLYVDFIEFVLLLLSYFKYIWYVPAMIIIALYSIINIGK